MWRAQTADKALICIDVNQGFVCSSSREWILIRLWISGKNVTQCLTDEQYIWRKTAALAQGQGYLLDIGCPGTQKTLFLDFTQSAHPCVAMTVQLLGIGKTAFNGFLATGINFFAICAQAVVPRTLPIRLPDMPGECFLLHGACCTRG